MRRVVATEFLSLDGVMQAPGSADEDRSGGFEHGGWHQPYFDEVQMQSAAEGIAETDAYLFGRRTYEIFASHWPDQPDSGSVREGSERAPQVRRVADAPGAAAVAAGHGRP